MENNLNRPADSTAPSAGKLPRGCALRPLNGALCWRVRSLENKQRQLTCALVQDAQGGFWLQRQEKGFCMELEDVDLSRLNLGSIQLDTYDSD